MAEQLALVVLVVLVEMVEMALLAFSHGQIPTTMMFHIQPPAALVALVATVATAATAVATATAATAEHSPSQLPAMRSLQVCMRSAFLQNLHHISA